MRSVLCAAFFSVLIIGCTPDQKNENCESVHARAVLNSARSEYAAKQRERDDPVGSYLSEAVSSHVRPATVSDYEQWLCEYLARDERETLPLNFFENDFESERQFSASEWTDDYPAISTRKSVQIVERWYVAKEDLEIQPALNSGCPGPSIKADCLRVIVHVIVPQGINVAYPNGLGKNRLYFHDGQRIVSDDDVTSISIFKNVKL